ncbi:MAG: SDR family oxidoreductase [Dehalococcoidia bacterium]|nr:MAG: SDR family oxidoreductase [Dehalococcoidia bacterium]
MKKAVVTGGAGFIGSNLADELINRGYKVIIIDDLSTGRLSNIESTLESKNAEFIRGSITNFPLLRKIFSGADYVFHQAALPSVPRSIKDPKTCNNINITGTLNVLVAARDSDIKKVIYASSSAVYGDTPTLPKTEDMILNPLSPYAVTKLTGEYYCSVFSKIYNLKTVCLRYFNVYGPRQDPNSPYAAVIPLFLEKVFTSNSPVIFGDGEQSRDFTFVKDVAQANILMAESEASGIFNLGSSQKVTINHLVGLITDIAGDNAIKPIYRDPRPGDIVHSLADISKARDIGYYPHYSLEEGLKETANSFRIGKDHI